MPILDHGCSLNFILDFLIETFDFMFKKCPNLVLFTVYGPNLELYEKYPISECNLIANIAILLISTPS